MSRSKKEEKQPKEKLFSDADEKIWQELKRETAKRAKSLGIISEADIECIIHEVRRQPIDPFSKDAKKRWDKIPKWAQAKILDNVYCGECTNTVSIVLETAEMQGADLILRGTCKTCGHEVCRLVEP